MAFLIKPHKIVILCIILLVSLKGIYRCLKLQREIMKIAYKVSIEVFSVTHIQENIKTVHLQLFEDQALMITKVSARNTVEAHMAVN